ncbi:uncharacterized protein C11orf70 homolog [Cimex lectularius]|uniref:Cilia- and flagella-associated protein 300 n=1 Tax=Cimex lectularius TaxID=79782 RepID=A0A8I6TCL4_CIMLE|nr:uncharacterized protein C11orf70 homolog [Cimex lectularius]
MPSGKFKFTAVGRKTCDALENKHNQELLMKWSLKGHMKVNYFNFNEPFHIYDMQDFVDSFFASPSVISVIQAVDYNTNSWVNLGIPASKTQFESVPCNVTSMDFFKRLEENNKLVLSGRLIPCLEETVDDFEGFYISNTLQAMVLDKHDASKDLYKQSERNQFIFQLFKHLVLGGKWCQYEDTLSPYLEVTKSLYKDLVSVERYEKEKNFFIRSVVLKCKAYGENGEPICPTKPDHIQNFIYLIIDPFKRQVAVLYNQFCEMFVC